MGPGVLSQLRQACYSSLGEKETGNWNVDNNQRRAGLNGLYLVESVR